MKNKLLLFGILSLFIFTGCGKYNQGIFSQNGTGVVLTSGTCILDPLNNVSLLVMDDLVKNCTETKSEWIVLDWLGWVFPDYVILKNQIATVIYDDSNIVAGIICEDTDKNGYSEKFMPTNSEDIPWYNSLTKVIGKWLIDRVAGMVYPDNMFCKASDTECKSMLDYGWRTDGKNYFAAWFRSNLLSPENLLRLYVINDKVYNPWVNKLGNGIMEESKRNFVSILKNKIIVKKIMQWAVIWDPQTIDVAQLKSKFILKTCEIDLQ